MRKNVTLFGIAVLITAIVFSFAACKNDTTDPLTDPALNGTWKHSDTGEVMWIFDNGTCEWTTMMKGTFTTSDNILTITPTRIWGEFLPSLGLTAKWYSKADLIVLITYDVESVINSLFAPKTYAYFVNGGSTLSLTEVGSSTITYIKQ